MSFENFIEEIEEIAMLPSPIKGDDGWVNPEEVQNKLYRHKDKLIYFDQVGQDEIQLPLIEAIYNSIENAITEDVREAIETSIESSMEATNKELQELSSRPVVTLAVVKKLVNEGIGENGKCATSGPPKIKLSTLTMLKEEGYTVTEIAELRDAGLI